MSSAVSDTPPPTRTYGDFYRHKSYGINLGPLKMGTAASIVGVGLLMVSFLIMAFLGTLVGLVFLVLTGGPFLVASIPGKHGRTKMDDLSDRRGARRNRKLNGGALRSGAVTKIGAHKLPGALAGSALYDFVADDGTKCSFVHYPDAQQYSASVFCEPDGVFGMDDSTLDNQVDTFGQWLGNLAHEPDLVQLEITIETAPDGGSPLKREIAKNGQPDRAADLSKRVMGQIAQQYPGGAAAVESYASFTFNSPKPEKNPDGTKHKASRDAPEAIGERLAATLPHLLDEMPDTGAGVVTPMTSQDVARVVRQAYNPADRHLFDQITARGDEIPQLDWSHCGPTASDETWDYYRHGSGASLVWEMTGLTSERIRADALLPLLQGHSSTVAMRVTFIYRTISPEEAAAIVESDFKAAQGRERDSKRPQARDQKKTNIADAARQREAAGAGLMMWACIVTATVADLKDIKKARTAIEHVAPTARLRLRLMHGAFAPTFAAGVGALGLDLEKNLSVIASWTKGL